MNRETNSAELLFPLFLRIAIIAMQPVLETAA